jgi:GMP synthase (glutamine-hydrolysing)
VTVEEYGFEPRRFISTATEEIRQKVGSERCILAISGGVDSTTCGVLLHTAIGSKLTCIFIDTGFMREGEPEKIQRLLTEPPLQLPLKVIEAKQRFLKALGNESDAEEKRKIFREEFYRILGDEVKKENIRFLAQGTIAPDWIETSGGIKTQHNVLEQIGINPQERFGFQIIEPLSELYKDQVRTLAEALNIPTRISQRQPFPGPGLLVRCVGKINEEKLNITKKACQIFESQVEKSGTQPQQYFAATLDASTTTDSTEQIKTYLSKITQSAGADFTLHSSKVTGVKGDIRVYGGLGLVSLAPSERETWIEDLPRLVETGGKLISQFPELTRILFAINDSGHRGLYAVALRAVNTRDFMTAEVTPLPWETLERTSNKILTQSDQVSAVYYDITPKPPATVEFE